MIPAGFAPLASHLWQSTVFAAAAALLALALRHNQARVRFWLWLAASYKFLLPFALLVSFGHLFQWRAAPATVPPAFSAVTDVVIGPIFLTAIPPANPAPDHVNALLFVICGVWACGFVVVAAGWVREWLLIRAIVRAASPLALGLPIRIVSTPTRLEPGVFGIFRPVLLLPEGIATRLTPAQLQAVLAHELCHVRRRDNLTAAIHMLVEAIFWFHPLVWWLGARMMDERERACDEEVLRAGSHAQAYAESILKVCEFYIESPLTCISGVTGSDLKKRIQRIMKQQFGVALSTRKKFLLATAAVVALAVPLFAGVLTAPRLRAQSATPTADRPKFEVASVKVNKGGGQGMAVRTLPGGHFSATNVPLRFIVAKAYQLSAFQTGLITGAPDWAKYDSERFDLEAKASETDTTTEQINLMLQSLLADRFKLAAHHETRQLPIFALVLDKPGKLGPHLQPHSDDPPCVTFTPPAPGSVPVLPQPVAGGFPSICGGFSGLPASTPGRVRLGSRNVTMEFIADNLTRRSDGVDRPVLDRTGLAGTFDFVMEWAPQVPPTPDSQPDSTGPTYVDALQDQLGLKLLPQTGPVEVLVIDHVEQPSLN